MVSKVQVTVHLQLEGLSPSDSAHQAAKDDFVSFAVDTPGVDVTERPDPSTSGTKGATSLILLSFASNSAAIGGAVRLFHLWLKRDRRRSLEVAITVDGKETTKITAGGDSVSLATLEKAIGAAIEHSDSGLAPDSDVREDGRPDRPR